MWRHRGAVGRGMPPHLLTPPSPRWVPVAYLSWGQGCLTPHVAAPGSSGLGGSWGWLSPGSLPSEGLLAGGLTLCRAENARFVRTAL